MEHLDRDGATVQLVDHPTNSGFNRAPGIAGPSTPVSTAMSGKLSTVEVALGDAVALEAWDNAF
jgi:hypothetical protein